MSDQAPAAAGPQLNGATKKAGDGSSLITAASILGGLVIWEVAARYVVGNPLFLSAPTQIAAEIGKLLGTGELQMHMAVSGLEFIIGLVISIVLGVGMGFLIATNRVANKIIGPWVALLYATPTIAIAPLIILWAGIDIWSKVIVVVINATFPMIINTEAGLRATDRKLVETVRCFGASRFQVFREVMFPSAIPNKRAGVRLAVGRAIVSVVVGELFGSRAGLGYMLAQAAEVFNMPRLFAAVSVLAITGLLLTMLAQYLERALQPWNRA